MSKYDLEVWDTSGEDSVASGSSDNLFDCGAANVYMICFAVNCLDSFYNARNKWYLEVQRLAPGVPVILIGTKCDLREMQSGLTMVSPDMGEQLKEEIKAFAYVECSARKRTRLDAVFENSVRCALSDILP